MMIKRFERMTFCLGAIVIAMEGSGARLNGQSAAPPTPSVQIVSVTVHPQTIHKELRPRSATVKVVVRCDGTVPAGSKAEVEVSTYSTSPPRNDAVYIPPEITLPLKRGKIVCKVKMQAGAKVVSGSIVVCADILEHGRDPSNKMPVTVSGFPITWPTTGSPCLVVSEKTLAP